MGRRHRPFAVELALRAVARVLFGAAYGTGQALPLAGAGLTAKVWQENTARILIAIGSLGSAGAVLAMLSQWHWAP